MQLFKVQKANVKSNLLVDRFIIPPFSVLDTRQGYWQTRKSRWISLGIESELGRDDNTLEHKSVDGKKLPQMAFTRGSSFTEGDVAERFGRKSSSQTSIFDPVLCEISYSWFSRPNDNILDPFAGGSVRGIVAGSLNRNYTGIDLSEKQIFANEKQYSDISNKYCGINKPIYILGDSSNVKNLTNKQYNMIFSCPPYYNLEVYSTKQEDLSYKATYKEFLECYRYIIKNCCDLLIEDSFAVFVVANFRDNAGAYYDFVGDTISAFTDSGLIFYNDAVIINVGGTLPIRVPNYFNSSRKLGKSHQNYLVFYKGNIQNIKNKFKAFENIN